MNEQLIGDLFAEATRRMTGSSSREFSQKFAQLIVQECMACSTWVGKVNENVKEPGPMHTAHAINQRIKKHFGVEE